MDNNKFILDF